MAEGASSNETANRTEFAEDRTVLANERTFAAWIRTAMATIAIALGFRALLRSIEPLWIAQAVATGFIAIGIIMVLMSYRRARNIVDRLDEHTVDRLSRSGMLWLTILIVIGAIALAVALWMYG